VREGKKGKEQNSFHGKRLSLLTCLLMGDPMYILRSLLGLGLSESLGFR